MATLSKNGRNELRDKGGGVCIRDKSVEDKNELLLRACVQSNVWCTMSENLIYYYSMVSDGGEGTGIGHPRPSNN